MYHYLQYTLVSCRYTFTQYDNSCIWHKTQPPLTTCNSHLYLGETPLGPFNRELVHIYEWCCLLAVLYCVAALKLKVGLL